jgi:SAM-dependent methyltransferase
MSYSADYFTARESWRDWRIEANLLIDLARVSKGTRVLEIGCGGGGLLRLLRERGASAVGIDTLSVALNLVRERLDADERGQTRIKEKNQCSAMFVRVPLVQIGEGGALPFRDAAFDAIVGQHVIEHLPDADAALREWKRLLKPGGRLALATPNADYPDPAHFADADHAHIFSPRELSDAAVRAGFAAEAPSTIFPFLTRARALRALGVIGHHAFQRAPYFSTRGRTIILEARKQENQ